MILHHVATEQVTVSNSAKTLTTSKVKTSAQDSHYKTIYADIDVQDANVYVTFDGSTTPSASAGEIWYVGDKKRVWGIHNLLNLQFIRTASTNAVLEVNYWGEK